MKRWWVASFSLLVAGVFCLVLNAQAQMMMTGAGKGALAAAPPITFVNSVGGHFSGASTGVTTAAINTSTGNFCVAYVSAAGTTAPALSDSQGNTWIEVGSHVSIAAGTASLFRYYVDPSTFVGNASHTFTLAAAANTYASIAVGCFAGVINSPFDVTDTGGTASATTVQVATGFTPTLDNELVTAGVVRDPGGDALAFIDSSFSISKDVPGVGGVNYGVAFAYIIQTSKTFVRPTWTAGNTAYNTSLESFK